MKSKTVVITGATSGIGEVAALALAKMGARIVVVARNKQRGDATLALLRSSAPDMAHSVHLADLSRLAEIKRVAAQIADRESRIDVLINNAGAMFATRQVTEDGLERTFALGFWRRNQRVSSTPRPPLIRALAWILTIFNPRRVTVP